MVGFVVHCEHVLCTIFSLDLGVPKNVLTRGLRPVFQPLTV